MLNIGSINGYCGERILLAYSISQGWLDDSDAQPRRRARSRRVFKSIS